MSETKIDKDRQPIGTGATYKNKETGEEVIPFFTDLSGTVVYAPVGSAREVRTDAASFTDTFELSTNAQEQEEQAAKDAEQQKEEAPRFAVGTAGPDARETGDGTTVDGQATKTSSKKKSS